MIFTRYNAIERWIWIGLISMTISCQSGNTSHTIIPTTPSHSLNLRWIDEYIFPPLENFNTTVVGGFSGIDYANDQWIVISDDDKIPRYYSMDISFNKKGFTSVEATGIRRLKNEVNQEIEEAIVDPESIRFINSGEEVLWTSEGKIKKGIDPSIYRMSIGGTSVQVLPLPNNLCLGAEANHGPRHNGTIEALSVSNDGKSCWVGMELPLKQDGIIPMMDTANYPVRMTNIDLATGKVLHQYVYMLDPLTRKATEGGLEINGVVEMLAIDAHRMLVLERAYAQGYEDGGNNVKLYLMDIHAATDVYGLSSLSDANYTPVKKELLLDFELIRSQLTESRVDNIEGMCFGPDFKNGNKSLVFVTDDNFQSYGHQLNQFLLFALEGL